MNIKLNYEQRGRLELLSLHAGKPAGRLLVEAAQFLLDRDAADSEQPRPASPQKFLSDAELNARLTRILRR